MNQSMGIKEDIKRDGLISQIIKRLGLIDIYIRNHGEVDHVQSKDQWSGRLTPTSGQPQANTSVSGATSIYFSPWNGNEVPLWDGAEMRVTQFAELTLTLNNPNHAANSLYPVFYFNNGTTRTIGTGPAWSTATARGTGAGTGELEVVSGVKVNRYTMTVRNGASTYSVPARYATHIGDILISTTVGQVNWTVTERGIWNRFNPIPFGLYTCPGYNDNSANTSYVISATTWTEANGGTGSRVKFILGEPQGMEFFAEAIMIPAAGGFGSVSIGIDTITNPNSLKENPVAAQEVDLTITENNRGVPVGIGSHYAALLFVRLTANVTVYADFGGSRYGASQDPATTFLQGTVLA